MRVAETLMGAVLLRGAYLVSDMTVRQDRSDRVVVIRWWKGFVIIVDMG